MKTAYKTYIFYLICLLINIGCENPTASSIIIREIDGYPNWSPVDNIIVYVHQIQIWLLRMETLEKEFVADGLYPSWSPDGKQIAFINSEGITVIDRKSKQVVTQIACSGCLYPSWSHSGNRIVVNRRWSLWIYNIEGGDSVQVQSTEGVTDRAIFTLDDKQLIFTRQITNKQQMLKVNILTGELIALTDTTESTNYSPAKNYSPALSHDGRHIAWNKNGYIWMMNIDGSEKRQITSLAGESPSWSPDDTQIVYEGYNKNERSISLWLTDIHGNYEKPLTKWSDYQ